MARLMVTFALQDDDPQRREEATHRLLGELRDLAVLRVDRVRGAVEEGAKAGAALEIGQLVLSGVFSTAALTAATKVLVARLQREGARQVVLGEGENRIEITGLSGKDQSAVVHAITAALASSGALDEGEPAER
ncbi:hypothetical protein [Saccharopolyspora cebuensis]|uniref:Uncharacterized protein n=1 Tax=Saccharopolyspora cebuensis TaxID=418759 RepID=A0ABV4CF98_9PSEU